MHGGEGVGAVVGGMYKLGTVIGHGSSGVVHQAYQQTTGARRASDTQRRPEASVALVGSAEPRRLSSIGAAAFCIGARVAEPYL
mmetsp:Transcript_30154/g.104210  ORF Transcript_30154/g.104210 Transcript_30154/m.104210 type:complete len:84 (-) Transcript_30154:2056-2307(-)